MAAKIVTDAGGGPSVGSRTLTGAQVNTPVVLTNLDDTGVLGWRWEVIDAPPESPTLYPLPAPTYGSSRTITPDVKGFAVLVRLTTYQDVARTIVDGVDQIGIGVLYDPPLDWLIPAAQETIEFNQVRGWATKVNRMFADLHNLDHGALTGLTDDDHTQYVLLAGRAGGQTVYGGTAASENLVLSATSHATKGYVTIAGLRERIAVGDTLWVDATLRNVALGSSDAGHVGTLSGTDNIAIGSGALQSGTSVVQAVAIGTSAAAALTTGASSGTFLGYRAGQLLTTSYYSVVIGEDAGRGSADLTHVTQAVVIGAFAGEAGSAQQSVFIGYSAGSSQTGIQNVLIGNSAGTNHTGSNGVMIGYSASRAASGANGVVAIGSGAKVPAWSVSIGYGAMGGSAGGFGNVAIGTQAGYSLTSGSTENVVIGGMNTSSSLPSGPSTGAFNVVIGAFDSTQSAVLAEVPAAGNYYIVIAGKNTIVVADPTLKNLHFGSNKPGRWRLSTGTDNSAFGDGALDALTTGARNHAHGSDALGVLTTGTDNIAYGHNAMTGAAGSEAALRNVAIGSYSLDAINAAVTDSTAVGYNAATAVTSAVGGTYLGSGAGAAVTTGKHNVLLGFGVAPTLTTGENNVVIGAYEGTSVYADTYSSSSQGEIVIAAEEDGEGTPTPTLIVLARSSVLIGEDKPGNWKTASGIDTVAIGRQSFKALTSGNRNIGIGSLTGNTTATGSDNILIGYNRQAPSAGTSNHLDIGGSIFGDLVNGDIRLGSSGAVSQTERFAVTKGNADSSEIVSFETTGSNGAKELVYVGTRDPNGNVTAAPGSTYYRVSGTSSKLYQNIGSGSGTVWAGYLREIAPICDLRLTGVTGTPVMTADSTALSTIYLTPWRGKRIALYVGSAWVLHETAEVSLAVTGRTADLPFDIFAYSNSGTVTLEFLDWTNSTTRATALTTQDGVTVKSGDATRRYMGSCRPRSATTFHWVTAGSDAPTKLDLWNDFPQQVEIGFQLIATTDSWTYTTATWRQAQGSGNYQCELMCGQQGKYVDLAVMATTSQTNAVNRAVAIGADSTTTPSGLNTAIVATSAGGTSGRLRTQPAAGSHYYAWLEYSVATGTSTWYGDNGGNVLQSGMTGSWAC